MANIISKIRKLFVQGNIHKTAIKRKTAKLDAFNIILAIRLLINKCKKYYFLDEQWYLNFKDELNKLSIDEDREDTCEG